MVQRNTKILPLALSRRLHPGVSLRTDLGNTGRRLCVFAPFGRAFTVASRCLIHLLLEMLTILLGNNFSPHGGTRCLSDGSTGCIFLSQGSKHRVILLLLLVLRLFVNVRLLRVGTRAFSGGSRRLNIRFTSLLLLVHSRQVWNFLLLLRSLPLSALGLVGVGALPLIRM